MKWQIFNSVLWRKSKCSRLSKKKIEGWVLGSMHRLLVEFSDVNSKPEADEWKLAGAGFKQVWRSPAYITREKSAIFIGRYIDNGCIVIWHFDQKITRFKIWNRLFVHSRINDMHLKNRWDEFCFRASIGFLWFQWTWLPAILGIYLKESSRSCSGVDTSCKATISTQQNDSNFIRKHIFAYKPTNIKNTSTTNRMIKQREVKGSCSHRWLCMILFTPTV